MKKNVMFLNPEKAQKILERLHKFYYSQILSQVYQYFDIFTDEEFREEVVNMACDMASHLLEHQEYYVNSIPVDLVKDGLLPFVMPNVQPNEDNDDGWGGYEMSPCYATYKEVFTMDGEDSLNFSSDMDTNTKVEDGEFYLDVSDILFSPMYYEA